MTLANFLDSKLFTSKINIYIVWIVATLLYLRQRVVPVINLSPIDLALQAGLIYGYYFAIIFALRLLAFPLLALAPVIDFLKGVVNLGKQVGNDKNEKDSTTVKIAKSLQGFTQRIIQVLGILAVFLFHPENLVYKVAPIGLILVLFFYIVSSDDEKKPETIIEVKNSEPDGKVENSHSSPIYVEIVNSNENPIEIKNSPYDPLYVDAGNGSPLPVNVVYGNTLPVQVVNDVQVSSNLPLPVEVTNVVTTQQDD